MKQPNANRHFVFLLLVPILAGCVSVTPDRSGWEDFAYQPARVAGFDPVDLRVAILPFRDAGSNVVVLSDLAKEEQSFYRYSDLQPWALAEEMRFNNLVSLVHFAPPVTEDYDLVVSGSVAISDARATGKNTFMTAQFQLMKPGSSEPLHVTAYREDLGRRYWVQIPLHLKLRFLQSAAHRFIQEAGRQFQQVAQTSTDKERRFAYYSHMDPQLGRISNSMAAHQRAANQISAQVLFGEYRNRLTLLEAYRQKEWDLVAAQVGYKEKLFQERLEEIARYTRESRELRTERYRQEQAAKEARKKQRMAVLAAALIATQGASKAGSSNTDALAKGLTALGNAPKLPPVQPVASDDSLLEQELNLTGLYDISTDAFGRVEGQSLADVRRKFKAIYANRARDVSRYLQR